MTSMIDTLTPVQAARTATEKALEHFDRVFACTSVPGVLQKAVCDLHATVDEFARVKREADRARNSLVSQPSDGRDMIAAGYTQVPCTNCEGVGRVAHLHGMVTCGRCSGFGVLYTRGGAA